jgi:hypothetical protein
MIWLGEARGNLSDWTTQRWVRATGRPISLDQHPWLAGPVGGTRRIGKNFFNTYATRENLVVVEDRVRGLIPDFERLELRNVAEAVREFYEQTSEFELDVWSEWHGLFRPFGEALSLIFSSRLQQLNVPLSSLDSARGMTSLVQQLRAGAGGPVIATAWVRELKATGKVIYAGSYSVCRIPGHETPCVKVAFPLPNGRAIVLMKTEALADGSLFLRSSGARFGDPGFYFVVQNGPGIAWARYVSSFKEEIRVYLAESGAGGSGSARADHRFWFWGIEFLRLHYRMRKHPVAQPAG